jgi:hypothetical protein
VFSGINLVQFGKALPVQVLHRFAAESAVFDDGNLVSLAGLVPVMSLAEQTDLPAQLAEWSDCWGREVWARFIWPAIPGCRAKTR